MSKIPNHNHTFRMPDVRYDRLRAAARLYYDRECRMTDYLLRAIERQITIDVDSMTIPYTQLPPKEAEDARQP